MNLFGISDGLTPLIYNIEPFRLNNIGPDFQGHWELNVMNQSYFPYMASFSCFNSNNLWCKFASLGDISLQSIHDLEYNHLRKPMVNAKGPVGLSIYNF